MAMHQICDHLYLGSRLALNTRTLNNNNIKHILTAVDTRAPLPILGSEPQDYNRLLLDIEDVEDANIMQHFDTTNAFIAQAIDKGENVLVHCIAGISRSATLVCAYLMQKNLWPVEPTLTFIRARREIINPNASFMEQLEIYYACGYSLTNQPLYRQWVLRQVADEINDTSDERSKNYSAYQQVLATQTSKQSSNLVALASYRILPVLVRRLQIHDRWDQYRLIVAGDSTRRVLDLDQAPLPVLKELSQELPVILLGRADGKAISGQVETISIKPSLLAPSQSQLRCRACGCTVATSDMFITHVPKNESAAGGQSRNGMALASSVAPSCNQYFVEPLSWMRDELDAGNLEGKLVCPKCAAKLGAYHWQGSTCSCGQWVVPAFMLQRGRVDESFRAMSKV